MMWISYVHMSASPKENVIPFRTPIDLTLYPSLIDKIVLLYLIPFQHARLMEPPSRASMWRVGFPTPVDEDDNQASGN